MMRKAGSSMQKCYDEGYLSCSLAVYYESQNNETEALRAWRNALDQIYYHNAYKLPSSYVPRSETEKALHESLRAMEKQCKERVDLLESLGKSREEATKDAKEAASKSQESVASFSRTSSEQNPGQAGPSWLGQDTVPPATYADIPRPTDRRPSRPSYTSRPSSRADDAGRTRSFNTATAARLAPPSGEGTGGRTPSPEKKGGMLKTLRSNGKERTTSEGGKMASSLRSKPPTAASKAAAQVWSGPQRPPMQSNGSAPAVAAAAAAPAVTTSWDPYTRQLVERPRQRNAVPASSERRTQSAQVVQPPSPSDYMQTRNNDPRRNFNRLPHPLLDPLQYRRWDRPQFQRQKLDSLQANPSSRARNGASSSQPRNDFLGSSPEAAIRRNTSKRKIESRPVPARAITPPTTDDNLSDPADSPGEKDAWESRVEQLMKKLPKGVDETAAKQIFNEVVIQGDEVHWDDVAGLEIAKSALKETVVYPFLRPDLFMGLREPARGMLLFGPPGTGKTMLARAVATESKSVFFAISASSLTSKFLGESEKLVRALFVLAKELAPSIIFVDEIDSLLGSRGGSSEHEATRRIKTEFLIQWSDLQKAAAGRESTEGDASRVLVLAATNLPWAIDEAARRRFVRRQYIPLPEDWVREKQLRTLLSAQKHGLSSRDLKVLVKLTDGFSGSDITALAKDAAMGPLRALGEKLLHMSRDDIRPISMSDFEASLVNIRPSVSKAGLKEFEDWATEFGERGG
ncbi:uncharacterized protein MYCGRDRAFT_88089 [Zymoseptoria tritici IPO323]|uniref:AAA+ ATPase domain-containing protein n=1 Tax=Zymoseptoria tritici (strain CBS 115943 / IPO323) TaxID=336722 RepID=F9XND5_ZYMTI|nr:uncharacterized protein MYCGRDRAFT_88089 [Zymoseptoria tritici IPO323]EGP83394.1 hypothetical protein MYCGRDRAFT_88089 [Zymoseptoria tritici IPO323]